jgi:long-chain acyl-CoA synthetase
MKGYYKDAEKTAETIDREGWLLTGDIGMITPQGTLAIIDRKKNIFKLAQGEYVAPEKLEAIYVKSDAVMQCFVHGDSLQSQLVGVVVLNPEKIVAWLRRRSVSPDILDGGLTAICADAKVKRHILDEMERIGKQYKLQGFELVKNVHLEPEMWSVENDMLTPSFKLKRNVAQKKYRKQLDRLYEELNAQHQESKL